MADFTVRASSVDVEQIMRQIRSRIREKRGVDYTEEQIQELARVKLERFLDPKGVRSDLLERFRQLPADLPPTYDFDDKTLFTSTNPLVRVIRRLLNPFLKLLFSPNALNQVLHRQALINRYLLERAEREALVYEVLHNLVVEVTRSTIEVKNMKMRVESIASRLEFNERRARALEAVVQYRSDAHPDARHDDRRREGREEEASGAVDPITGGESLRTRRRRRRRGRRSGAAFAGGEGGEAAAVDAGSRNTGDNGAEDAPRGADDAAANGSGDDRAASAAPASDDRETSSAEARGQEPDAPAPHSDGRGTADVPPGSSTSES
ncbi:MAG TPA: hypothetical protein VF198_17470 [Vicinamibacterales bacterium]